MYLYCNIIYLPVFAWFMCSFGMPSLFLVAYHLARKGMPLPDAVCVNWHKGATTDIKVLAPMI